MFTRGKVVKVLLMMLACIIAVSFITGTAGAKEEIRFMSWGAAEWVKTAMDMRWEEFKKTHPDVKLTIVPIPWADYWMKLLISIAGGNPPDAAVLDCGITMELVEKGALEPITDLIKTDPPVNGWEDFAFRDDITVDGEIYGLITGGAPRGFHYNVDIFNGAGLSSPTDLFKQGKWTWDDFVEVAKKLTVDNDGDGIIDQYGFGGFSLGVGWQAWEVLTYAVRSAGGKLFDKLELPDKCLLNTPEAKNGIQFIVDIMTKHNIAPPYGAGLTGFAFYTGNVAMEVGNPASSVYYSAALDLPFEWDVTYPPTGAGGLSLYGIGCTDAILSPAKNKKLVYEMIKSSAEPEVWFKLGKAGVYWYPALFSVLSSQRFHELYPDFDMEIVLDWYNYMQPFPKVLNYYAMGNAAVAELQAGFSGEKTADQVAEDLTRALNELIEESR